MKMAWQRVKQFIGFPASSQHPSEQVVASIGGVVSIVLVMTVTKILLGSDAAILIIPSAGASTVLIFAMPHSVFAQPWSVMAGNVLSALVGVCCYRWVPDLMWAAALAVGMSIAVMHLARCMHPPGGATALAAVIGGPAIYQLGFSYALSPVALNGVIMLVVGVAFNQLFAWRRYPVSLMRYAARPKKSVSNNVELVTQEHVSKAMERLNVLMDVSPEEMTRIFRDALDLAQSSRDAALHEVKLGHFYCNDLPGQQWSVRQIIDERRSSNPRHDMVIYKVVDGEGLNRTGNCERLEFARWVGSELQAKKISG